MEIKTDIKISIIIPVYNTEKYLEKCLRSIINQSLKEIEIICVNDGSKDNSLEILKRLSKEDKRIIIIDKKNGGSSSARNAALKVAQGKYCLNIDSDDWIEQGYLKEIYERAEKDNLDITITNIIFDYPENHKKNYILNDLEISDNKILKGKEYIEIFFKYNSYGYTCNKLIKRELYFKNNLQYDEEIFLLEDVEMLLMLSYYAKKIGKLNKVYYHYVQGENNGSYKITIKSLKDIKICMNKLSKFYEKKEEKNIVNFIKQDKIIHLMRRILENNYLEKEEYNKFLITFVEELKKEKVSFEAEFLNSKYKKFLVIIVKLIRITNMNIAFLVIRVVKKILFMRRKLKGN